MDGGQGIDAVFLELHSKAQTVCLKKFHQNELELFNLIEFGIY